MDTATLVIALVGLALSVFSVGWQVASHQLSGSRPHAKAIVGKVNPTGFAHWPVDGQLRLDDKAMTMPGEWFLGVLVHNRGRIPVDVTGYQLQFDSGPAYGEMGGFAAPASAEFNPPRPRTLGPGQQAMWTLELTGVQGFLEVGGKQLHSPGRNSLLVHRPAGIYARMTVNLGTGRTARSHRFRLDSLT